MSYRLWFYVAVIASFILSGFLIGVTLHAQRVSDHAQQVTNDLKDTRYLMAANALNLRNLRRKFRQNYIDAYSLDLSNVWIKDIIEWKVSRRSFIFPN